MEYELIRTDGSHPGFLTLIKELDRELRSFESDHDDVYITQNIVPESVYVSLILHDSQALACACLRAYEEKDFELKRMYVLPGHRGKGLYSSSGFERINNYGHYRDIQESICYAKKIPAELNKSRRGI